MKTWENTGLVLGDFTGNPIDSRPVNVSVTFTSDHLILFTYREQPHEAFGNREFIGRFPLFTVWLAGERPL